VILSSRAFQIAALSAFAAATLAVAGCGGGSSSSTPAVSPSTPTPTASGNGNGSGSSATFTFTQTGGTGNITAGASGSGTLTGGAAAVGGVTISSTWGANTSTTVIAMTAQLATGNGDITATTTAFPAFGSTSATVVDNSGNALSGYSVVDYLKLTATPVTTFSQTPAITVTGATTTGKTTCSYFTLGGSVGSAKWQQAITANAITPNVTFAAQALGGGNTVDVGNDASAATNGSAILALACK
jgi:hypothetical protein